MARIRCPYCGAEFEAPEGFRYVVCPYCGTVIEAGTGRRSESWVYPVRLEEQDAYTLAVSRASQLPGAPRDIESRASYAGGELHYIPLYVCRARALARGCPGAGEELEETAAAAAVEWLPEGYRFPAAGRVAYDPSTARRGVFHQVERGWEEVCTSLRSRASAAAAAEAVFSGCTPEGLESDAELVGIAHYPFWLIRYGYPLGGEYLAAVDAVDGEVVYAEYPIPAGGRAALLAAAAAALASGAAAGAAVAHLAHQAVALAGALASLAAAAPFLGRAAARRGRYRLEPWSSRETIVRSWRGEKTPAPAASQERRDAAP